MTKRRKKMATDRTTLRGDSTEVELTGEDMKVVLFKENHTIRTFDILSMKLVSSIIYLAIEERKGLVGKVLLGNHPLLVGGEKWFNPEEGVNTTYSENDGDESMAHDMHVCGILHQIFVAARSGGMTEKRSSELWDEILGYFSNLSPDGALTLFTNLFSMMVQLPKDP